MARNLLENSISKVKKKSFKNVEKILSHVKKKINNL